MNLWKIGQQAVLAAGLLLTAATCWAAPALSVYQDHPTSYIQGSAGQVLLAFDGGNDMGIPIVSLGVGAMMSRHFGVEVRLATTPFRKHYEDRKYRVGHLFSALGTYRLQVWEKIYAQAYAGISDAKYMIIDARGDTTRNDETTLSYGLNLGLMLSPTLRVSVGYTSYINKSGRWQMTAGEGTVQYLF